LKIRLSRKLLVVYFCTLGNGLKRIGIWAEVSDIVRLTFPIWRTILGWWNLAN